MNPELSLQRNLFNIIHPDNKDVNIAQKAAALIISASSPFDRCIKRVVKLQEDVIRAKQQESAGILNALLSNESFFTSWSSEIDYKEGYKSLVSISIIPFIIESVNRLISVLDNILADERFDMFRTLLKTFNLMNRYDHLLPENTYTGIVENMFDAEVFQKIFTNSNMFSYGVELVIKIFTNPALINFNYRESIYPKFAEIVQNVFSSGIAFTSIENISSSLLLVHTILSRNVGTYTEVLYNAFNTISSWFQECLTKILSEENVEDTDYFYDK